MVFWHQTTLCKGINQVANSINYDLPAFSLVQTASLWKVIYHRRDNYSPENSGTRKQKSTQWHFGVSTKIYRRREGWSRHCKFYIFFWIFSAKFIFSQCHVWGATLLEIEQVSRKKFTKKTIKSRVFTSLHREDLITSN